MKFKNANVSRAKRTTTGGAHVHVLVCYTHIMLVFRDHLLHPEFHMTYTCLSTCTLYMYIHVLHVHVVNTHQPFSEGQSSVAGRPSAVSQSWLQG